MQSTSESTAGRQAVVPLRRLLPGLVIGPASWLGPYIASVSLFLPAMIAMLDEDHKIELVATFATAAMIVAAISNMIAGALSDRTKTRWGKRTPWLVIGGFAFMLAMISASLAPNVPILFAAWLFGQVALNFIVAPMVAWIDMAPEGKKATASSVYGGLGMALGNNGFNIVAAMLLGQFRLGFAIFGSITFIGTLIAAIIVREPSNLDEQFTSASSATKQRISLKSLKTVFPAWRIGRDYYLALMGKLCQGIGNFAVMGYLLYIMTDFMGLTTDESTFPIQLINTIMLVFGIAMGFLAGPLSDRFNLLKWPIAFSALLLGIGALGMFFLRDNGGIIVYGVSAGLGMGLWNSLDNYLNLRVIPDKSRVAFFLGVYNLGNTLTQAIAPVLAAVAIGIFGFSSIFLMSFVFAIIGGVLIAAIRSVRR
ncbi:MFS transporter [Brooklawnia sp.]|uniref:MFS transporter n=1 Tax=Brooklawnia sp. TaxID=2699740 RepID=UPI00311D3DC1